MRPQAGAAAGTRALHAPLAALAALLTPGLTLSTDKHLLLQGSGLQNPRRPSPVSGAARCCWLREEERWWRALSPALLSAEAYLSLRVECSG